MLRSMLDTSLAPTGGRPVTVWPVPYLVAKRLFDLLFSSVVLMPLLLFVASALLLLNPFLNPGPLLYRPERMGRGCVPFRLFKFRTMRRSESVRAPDDPVELDRVTPLGAVLRRSRFDELPQIFNVFRGEMSLIGPRPDDLSHARAFLRTIPGYRQRYAIRPGISGLAQVELGYVHGRNGAIRKTSIDLDYISRACPTLDARIFWRTLRAVMDMKGQ